MMTARRGPKYNILPSGAEDRGNHRQVGEMNTPIGLLTVRRNFDAEF